MNSILSHSDCLHAAMLMETAGASAPDPELLGLCANTLRELAGEDRNSAAGLKLTMPFLLEANRILQLLCVNFTSQPQLLHDRAFALLECMAVITKERSLNKRKTKILPAQAALMRYFESSGQWSRDDGTLVSDYYYTKIPASLANRPQ